jgi:plastocyanin
MKAFSMSVALLFVAFAAIPAACSSQAAAAQTTAAPAVVVVHLHDFMMDPSTVTVAPGTTVEWDNDDGARHTITATDKSFDSGDLKPGQKWTHTFASPGTFAYTCTQHPEMTGTVIVSS